MVESLLVSVCETLGSIPNPEKQKQEKARETYPSPHRTNYINEDNPV